MAAVEGLTKESSIENPFAKTIMSLRINDQLQTQLQSNLPPRETAKLLMSTAFDLVFGYVEAMAEANKTKLSR